jgi:hypothetical protein
MGLNTVRLKPDTTYEDTTYEDATCKDPVYGAVEDLYVVSAFRRTVFGRTVERR